MWPLEVNQDQMAESEEELNNLLMRKKEENEDAGLNTSIQKN